MDLPMFPLGSVLLPGQLMPLHIFEARYQAMLEHCRTHGDEFGVVLIQRGHEVGGGDIRSDVATVARILDITEAAPGHWAIITAGVRRVRVTRWHQDEPWPHADVEPLTDDDEPLTDDDGGEPVKPVAVAVPGLWTGVLNRLTVIGDIAAAMGDESYTDLPDVSDDPRLGSFQVTALSPLGAFDRQKILATTNLPERLRMLTELLDDVIVTLRAARSFGGGSPFGA
ncbi:MAG: LON peptidase substrate-binding domain-containing protein [Nakamurella sp.]